MAYTLYSYISGAFTGYGTSIIYCGVYLYTSQSTSGNYTDCRVDVYFKLVNTAYWFYNTTNHSCTTNINGTTNTDTDADYTVDSAHTNVLVKTQTTRVYHNSNGAKSIYWGSGGNTNTSLGTYSVYTTQALPTITRATAVSSTAASSVGETSATTGGTVTDAGLPVCSQRGVYWGTSSGSQPNKVISGSGAGAFTAQITGLAGGTQYFFKAFAYNTSGGYRYGSVLNFTTDVNIPDVTTTAITAIDYDTGTSGGNVTDDHGASVTERGVVYNTTGTPTISDTKVITGSGTGSYVSVMTSLTPLTTYYVRAFATNSEGTAYGSEVYFDTLAAVPTVVTDNPALSIATTSATLEGEVTADNGASITERGFVYGTSANPTVSDSKLVVAGTVSTMSTSATSLTSATEYNFRGFATNSFGTAYGANVAFTTIPTDPTSLVATATEKTTIDLTWAKGTGDYTIIRRDTTWPANINSGTLVYNSTGTSTTDTSLTQGTEYFYRAWSGTEAYGSGTYSDSYVADSETTVADFTNPDLALTDDSSYAEVLTSSGGIKCQVSKDNGSTWSLERTITPGATPAATSFGDGDTELWGMSFVGSDMDDGSFLIKLTGDSGESYQMYGGFGFSLTDTVILTGVEVEIKAGYSSPDFYLYYVKVDPNYGTSPLPIGAGSLAYDTTLGLPTYYDGVEWNPLVQELGDLGITATADEINILDGATLTTAELNKLDGLVGEVVGTTDIQDLSNKTFIDDTTFEEDVTFEENVTFDKLPNIAKSFMSPKLVTPGLGNNWKEYHYFGFTNQTWNSPGYYMDAFGFVHMEGLMKSGTNVLAFILPEHFIGNRKIINALQTYNNFAGRVDIWANESNRGEVQLVTYSTTWSCLDQIKFSTFERGWVWPTMENSWVEYQTRSTATQSSYEAPGYYKDELGFVHLRGLAKSGTIGATMFTLPAGYRPEKELIFSILTNHATAAGSLTVEADGKVTVQTGANGWVPLENVYFMSATSPYWSEWQSCTYPTGFGSYEDVDSTYQGPVWWVSPDGVYHVMGLVDNTDNATGIDTAFLELPSVVASRITRTTMLRCVMYTSGVGYWTLRADQLHTGDKDLTSRADEYATALATTWISISGNQIRLDWWD